MAGDASHGTILYLEDITVSFDGFKALNALTLYIDAGELRCIIGPNGAGKTTMMDVITGKTRPDSRLGVVWSDDRPACADGAGNRPRQASDASFRSPRCSSSTRCSRTSSLRWRATSRVWQALFARLTPARARSYRRGDGDHRARSAARPCRPAICRTVRSSGSRSACC